MKIVLRTFAIITILVAATFGVCNSNKTRQIKQSQGDVPRCIPMVSCPTR